MLTPTSSDRVVFLLDVDNTLLDNDRFAADLGERLLRDFGAEGRDRYWARYAALREKLGYADYLATLQEFRMGLDDDADLLQMSSFMLEYPFAERVYPDALAAVENLHELGTPVVFSDGDVVFQPRKVQRSGLWDAVKGRVLIYPHKQRMLDAMKRRFPAPHYVMIDDKPHLLAAMKSLLGEGLTTVFVRQGHYAREAAGQAINPQPDLVIERVGELAAFDLERFGLARFESARGLATASPGSSTSKADDANRLQQLRDAGQSLWLDNITREMLEDGTLQRYIDAYAITGLTSNPTIFNQAIGNSGAYDAAIREKTVAGKFGEALLIELALEDLRRAADLFAPVFDATNGVDGWTSMELSPLLAGDTAGSISAASRIHRQAGRANLFVKIPGTPEGIPAIEESIFNGVPINVTLLFSTQQYRAAAEAYLRGIERRVEAGLDPVVGSVASLFVSRWDKASAELLPPSLRNQLGIAMCQRTYRAYRELLVSARWRTLAALGARPQRLLWASTGSKDPDVSDTMYVEALAAPDTINTLPEKTLRVFAEHAATPRPMAEDGGDAEATLQRLSEAGIDIDALATRLQREGTAAFVASWQQLLQRIADKAQTLAGTRA